MKTLEYFQNRYQSFIDNAPPIKSVSEQISDFKRELQIMQGDKIVKIDRSDPFFMQLFSGNYCDFQMQDIDIPAEFQRAL